MLVSVEEETATAKKSSRKLRFASVIHYEQAFFIRQVIASSVPVVCLLVRQSIPSVMFACYLVVAVTCLNLFYYWLTVTGRFRSSFKWAQIAVDMFLWTLLIHLTGGKESVFFFLYPLEILVAAFTLSVSGCIYGAVVAGLFYSVEAGFLGSQPGFDGSHVVRIFFLSAIAALSVLVVRKLERKTTEVKKLSDQLRERAERAETNLGAVLDNLSSGLAIVDEKGRLLSMNGPFARMCGVSDGRAPSEIPDGTPLDKVRVELLNLLNKGPGEKRVELVVPGESGDETKVFLNTKVFDRYGERCIMAIASEETDETEKTGELVSTDSLPGVGESMLVVAHEVRNSMTCIMGLLSLLHDDLSHKAESVGLVQKAVGAVEDLDRFVSNLLLYSKRVEPRFERVDLVAILDSVTDCMVRRVQREKKISLTKDFAIERLEAEVDPRHIQRVLMNLLLNAYQAVAEEGSISILLRHEDSCAVIEVRDDGCGLPAECISKVFEPFYTTKGTGNGLGLAIARKLVEAHEGSITASSDPRSGTVFTVRLPVVQEARTAQGPTARTQC